MSNLPPTSQEIELQARLADNPGSVVCWQCKGRGDIPVTLRGWVICSACIGEGIVPR